MRLRFILPLLSAAAAAALATSTDAAACGGCVVPIAENTVVTGHRMALSISTKQTVLWDQIKYDGDPKSFGWLLPVKPGAVIEVSTDAWFETLDATTSASVFSPPVNCNNSGPGLACGAYAAADSPRSADGLGPGGGVTVVHRGTVGPYETVTLSTQTPGVLNDWLTAAGYEIDPASQPVVDAYVDEGFDFIALKLQPTSAVNEMKPVRVVQPGASPTLPLRMVAVGTGASVAVTLFLITEGRWAAKNFGNAVVPLDLLSWDFQDNSSNYASVREKLLAANGGATWLTAFAQPKALLSPLPSIRFGLGLNRTYSANGDSFDAVETIGEAYIQRGMQNGEAEIGQCSPAVKDLADSGLMVFNPCPAGKPSDDPSCAAVDGGQIDARKLECGKLDDLAVAFDGLHPKDVWLTRLEANLPRAALAEDLVLEAAAVQAPTDNEMQARKAENVDAFCGSQAAALPLFDGKGSGGPQGGGALVVGFGMMASALLGVARRRARA